MSPTKTDDVDVMDAEVTEDETVQEPYEDEADPSFDGPDADEIAAEEDDDCMEVSDDAYIPERSYANAVPAPTGVWLAAEVTVEHSEEDNKFDPGNPQLVVYAEYLSPEFGGRRWPLRTFISKNFKPREFENQRKPRPGDKGPVSPLDRLVAASKITTPENKRFYWSKLPEQIQQTEMMIQLSPRKAVDQEFGLLAVYGEQCALVSPVNGHHFSNEAYDIVKDPSEDMYENPAYAIHTDPESGAVTVLKPRFDEGAIKAKVKTEYDNLAAQMDDSRLTQEEQDEFLARAKRFSERRARKLAYYNPLREEVVPAGAVFADKFDKDQEEESGEKAKFGADDNVFTEDDGFGKAPGTEILDYEKAPLVRKVSVTAVKGTKVEDTMSLEDLIKTERIGFGKFAPLPEIVLGVKEEGKDRAPHYEVIWAHVGRLAIGDAPVRPSEEVDALDLESDTGELVTLIYGADSAWHIKVKSDNPA